MLKILRKFASFQTDKGNPLAELNRMRQFIFTGATIPKTITTSPGQDALATINEWFLGGIKHVRTDGCHRISPLIDQQWIDLDGSSTHLPTTCKMSEDYDLNLLVDVVKRSL